MKDWIDTGRKVIVSADLTFRDFEKAYPPGAVQIGGNDRASTGSKAMYFVIIDSAESAK